MKFSRSWKASRELRRIVRQLREAPGALISYYFASKYYDLFMANKIRRTEGSAPISAKVAIYLIYPSHGLQPSHLRSLEYLLSKGYAPIVVSNLYLSQADRQRLLQVCHICIERPNFGYDFGGYRDGILTVASELQNLQRLLLINDSTWFALPGSSDWLEDSEAMNVDLAAAASNYGIPRVEPKSFQSIRWNYRTTHKNFHFCSFALLFSNRVLADRAFARFWRSYPLSNQKSRTVRRGEIGLSKWVLSHGFTYGVSYDIAALHEDLEKLDDARLHEIAANLMVPEDRRMFDVKQEVLAGNPDRHDLISLILTGVARQGSSYALADFAINERRFPFLKKSPVWLNREASDITLRLASGLPGTQGAEILAEARALRLAKAPQFDRQP